MPEKKSYPGTISSIILSVIVVMLLLLPFATANRMEKIRNGEGKFEFREVMCFDINEKSHFQGDDFSYLKLPFLGYPTEGVGGTGACYMNYLHQPGSDQSHSQVPVIMSSVSRNGVIDGYGVTQVKYISGYPPQSNTRFYMYIFTTLTKADILDQETTRLDVYLDIPLMDCDSAYTGLLSFGAFGTYYRTNTGIKSTSNFKLDEVYEMELTVDDLLKINSLDDTDILGFQFSFAVSKCSPCPPPNGANIFFDMQIYCIKEFEILTIDWIGIAMIGGGIFMGFCSILMLPHITFSGVMGRIVGKRGE